MSAVEGAPPQTFDNAGMASDKRRGREGQRGEEARLVGRGTRLEAVPLERGFRSRSSCLYSG